jgi:hypothetical protein
MEDPAMSTNIAIELPDDIARVLREKWGDLSQHTIEALAAEGYRTRALSGAQLPRLLGLDTRLEVDAFLKQHGVYLNYPEAEFEKDLATLHQLRGNDRRLGRGATSLPHIDWPN